MTERSAENLQYTGRIDQYNNDIWHLEKDC